MPPVNTPAVPPISSAAGAPHASTRRDFLRVAAALPWATPFAAPRASPWLRQVVDGGEAALLVLELAGGNDGLNTLVPVEAPEFARLRPKLSAVRTGAHRLRDTAFALHPSLGAGGGLFALMQRGLAAAVHGVGYPQPDRSHFKSRDIWHTADPGHDPMRSLATGWLGRAADTLAGQGATMPALGVGDVSLPLVLRGGRVVVPVLARLQDYALQTDGDATALTRVATTAGADDDDLQAFVRAVAASAVRGAQSLQDALAAYRPRATYPEGQLGRDLQLAAQVLVSGFGTRLMHLTFGGFDTHAQQLPTHAALLRQLAEGLAALCADLEAHGRLADTVVMVCSEFGRRAAENGSLGTDHGAAAPVFVLGGGVRPGLHGTPPDLRALVDGDVAHTTDFRQVYAALLGRLGIAVRPVLGADHPGLSLFD